MKAKNYIYGVMLVSALLAGACDYISEDERFIYVEPAKVAKRVLVEDFTGQSCVNCPAANEIIKGIQTIYGKDNVIAVAIHCGPFSKTDAGIPYPLYTKTGDDYYNSWGIQNQPSVMIDRHGVSDLMETWATIVYNSIQQSAPLFLDVACSYNEKTSVASISVKAEGVDSIEGKLQVWLTEDSIVSLQFKEGNVIDYNYMHSHVFRKSVNDNMGDDFSIRATEEKTVEYTTEIDSKWNVRNVSAVVFVYNDDGVLQAAEAKVVDAVDE